MARVLVVENDPATRKFLRLHLESETHDVITAEDGEEGLRMAISARPDLILAESRIPRLDGIDFLSGIRADRRTAAIPFIFLTDAEDGAVRSRSRSLQVADYLQKPFDRERLLEAVSRQAPADRTQSLFDEDEAVDDLGDDDHMATVAMAPSYAIPLPSPATPVRDATTRAVEGTVFFFAIRDFHRIAETIGEDLHLEFINAFHKNVRDLVASNSGWIVKTTESGFIAMFEDGVTSVVHHAERAAKTAILCLVSLHGFGPWLAGKLRHAAAPKLIALSGLHSGTVSVCSLNGGKNSGKTERTIVGDAVNVASRLQSIAGELGWGIVCSAATIAGAGPRFATGRRGHATVKGRKTPVDIVEVVALRPKAGGESADNDFYAAVGRAIGTNNQLIAAENAARQQDHEQSAQIELPSAPPPPESPVAVMGYQVLRKIGEGGMAQVYLARHTATTDLRVLKLVRLTDAHDGEAAKRFVQEYALLMQVSHPGVARVYQHGHENGHAYMAMEYFAGGDLRARMKERHTPAGAVSALLQIAGGITAVHRTGVVHRDLKPDNIMIRADGSMAIADFGIAKKIGAALGPTQHGDILGTPYYLSPEQVMGLPTDHRSDIYSLGVLFYEMLTGQRAYQADSVMGLMRHHVDSPVPVLPPALDRFQPLLDRMMSKDRDKRFGGAAEIEDFVTHYQLA